MSESCLFVRTVHTVQDEQEVFRIYSTMSEHASLMGKGTESDRREMTHTLARVLWFKDGQVELARGLVLWGSFLS